MNSSNPQNITDNRTTHSATCWVQFLVFGLLATTLIGCGYMVDRPPLGPPKPSKSREAKAKQAAPEIVEAPLIRFTENWEAWYTYMLNNKQVGYGHVVAEAMEESVDRASKANIRYTVNDQVTFRRGISTFVQHLIQSSTETAEGQLLNFDSELRVGPFSTTYHGNIEGQRLEVETIRGTARNTDRETWESTYRGLTGIEQSLRRKPMTKGETRTLKMLLPVRHQIAVVKMVCSGSASIPMLDGEFQELMEIVTTERLSEGRTSERLIWVNELGEILKTLQPISGLVGYRTDQATALASAVKANEVVDATQMDVAGTISNPKETMRAAYLLTPSPAVVRSKGKISVPLAPGQYVRELPDGSIQVLVSRKLEAAGNGFKTDEFEPVKEDLQPNGFIDNRAHLIRQLAAVSAGKTLSSREVAMELLRTTHDLIDEESLSTGLNKASVIARDATGGSIEHALLLAAFLRARGIPSRIAAGLIYVPEQELPGDRPRMVYHMWTLAYVDGEWLSLDATLGTVAPADRIALVTTNLAGGNEHAQLAPAFAAFGRVEIKIIRATK